MKKHLIITVWFCLLLFPFVVLKLPLHATEVVTYRWFNLPLVAVIAFVASFLWEILFKYRQKAKKGHTDFINKKLLYLQNKKLFPVYLLIAIIFPLITSDYNVSIFTSTFVYIVLGLGLNIVVGLAGLLDLGYVAFYAVGAYSYALLNLYFHLTFWQIFPIAGLLAFCLGVLLGFPVLRLKGDYLAIVTLGFGEIIRLILYNWTDLTKGIQGIGSIPKPNLPGIHLTEGGSNVFLYYILLALIIIALLCFHRLRNSRVGRAWEAFREDEIACISMGIHRTKTKLAAFGIGASWAGFAGIIFASHTGYINPASFTFYESSVILTIVILGGMGSPLGVIIASALLILLPEYFRFLNDYRMLIFAMCMIGIMLFKPNGLLQIKRKQFDLDKLNNATLE